jgi:hypothetical protein
MSSVAMKCRQLFALHMIWRGVCYPQNREDGPEYKDNTYVMLANPNRNAIAASNILLSLLSLKTSG